MSPPMSPPSISSAWLGASYILGMPTALAQWQTTMAEIVIVFLFVPFLIRAHVATVPQYLARASGPACGWRLRR